MNSSQMITLVNVFSEHGDFRSKIWERYEKTCQELISHGKESIEHVLDVFVKNQIEENISSYMIKVMGRIGDIKAIPYLRNYQNYVKQFPYFQALYFELVNKALIEIEIRNSKYAVESEKMHKMDLGQILSYITLSGKNSHQLGILGEKIIIERVKSGNIDLKEMLKSFLGDCNQVIMFIVLKCLREIQDLRYEEILYKILEKDTLHESDRRNVAISLLKLGKEKGLDELKKMSLYKPPNDVSWKTVDELYLLGLKNVFSLSEIPTWNVQNLPTYYPILRKLTIQD